MEKSHFHWTNFRGAGHARSIPSLRSGPGIGLSGSNKSITYRKCQPARLVSFLAPQVHPFIRPWPQFRAYRGTASDCGTAGGNQAFGTVYTLQAGLRAPAAVITAFSPSTGAVGTRVTVRGDHFVGTRAVKFNGVGAIFKILNGKFLSATVPVGATTGPISVTNPAGTTTNTKNFVIQ
jgi:IPT/TIG domain